MRIVRVFPRRTSFTPTDALTFIGDPPLFRPGGDEVHISVAFTWDKPEAERLALNWGQYYPEVRIGGPAYASQCDGFTPGLYVKPGVTFTSRGCNNNCPWCLVPEHEGRLRMLTPIPQGHTIQDNNFLQCSRGHRLAVYAMLNTQRRAATFAGGLEAALINDDTASELRDLRIQQVFFSCDTDAALKPLARAREQLHFLPRQKFRVYVLCGFAGQTIEQAQHRLEAVWVLDAMPFAQLYQPADKWLDYSHEWRALARTWSRPAAMKAVMGAQIGGMG